MIDRPLVSANLGHTNIQATIIADSTNGENRLTTMAVTGHRFILAEFNTHRDFSRNSASSRAIPFQKQYDRVEKNCAFPVVWASEQKGMQGGAEISGDSIVDAVMFWEEASKCANGTARHLHELGVHKSLCNRLLEPFMWHTIIVSATEWDNFFRQRCHPDAQPEMKALADTMQLVYYTSKPMYFGNAIFPKWIRSTNIKEDYDPRNEWHLPYIDDSDIDYFKDNCLIETGTVKGRNQYVKDIERTMKMISVARCARVSYLQHDGTRDHLKDLELYNKLCGGEHWSPFEHVARPGNWGQRSGNFVGWIQHRHEVQTKREVRRPFIPNLPELAEQAKLIQEGKKPWQLENQE